MWAGRRGRRGEGRSTGRDTEEGAVLRVEGLTEGPLGTAPGTPESGDVDVTSVVDVVVRVPPGGDTAPIPDPSQYDVSFTTRVCKQWNMSRGHMSCTVSSVKTPSPPLSRQSGTTTCQNLRNESRPDSK